MYLKTFFALCFVFITSINSYSQSITNNVQNERAKMFTSMLPLGHLYGKIIDQQTKKSISFASVTLISVKGSSSKEDSVIGGCFTEKNGDFSIDNIKVISPAIMMVMMGRKEDTSKIQTSTDSITNKPHTSKVVFPKYVLKISIAGYDDYQIPISFSSTTSDEVDIPNFKMSGDDNTDLANAQSARSSMMNLFNNLDKDLGNISLQPKAINTASKNVTLNEVTITTNKNQAELSIDKRSYNVANMPLAENGTAVDVMKNIPALNVDINGNVSLRNASPQIYIDGQPTDLTLDMIPSEMIEKVEVISNPSAKYDAGAATGILNIITKKNDKVGYFGMVRLGIDRFGLPSGGGNVSIRKKKVNFNLVLFGMMRKMEITGATDRNSPTSKLHQEENGSNMRFNMISVRPSFDFYITNRTTLTIGGGYTMRNFNQYSIQDILQQNFDNNGSITSSSFQNRNGNTQGTMNMPSANIGLVQLFPKDGEKLTATVRYNGGYVDRPTLLHQQQWDGISNVGEPLSQYYQQTNSNNHNERVRMQVDYENPIHKNMELDAGFSGQYRYTSQNYNVYQAPTNVGLITDANEQKSLRNIYTNVEQTYALYVNFKHQIKLPNADYFSYQVGLRGELYFNSAQVKDSANQALSYQNNYYKDPWTILFPSVFLSYKMPNSGQEFQFNYTRRVNRPFFMLTNPYINYLDSLNVTQGNPNLKPAFSNYFELNYNKDIMDNRGNKHNIFVALYANYTTGMITNYQYQMSESNPLIITSYVNAGTSIVSGLEITPQFQLFTWWTLKPSFNLYYSNINTPAQDILNGRTVASHSEQWSYYAKLSMDFSLPKEFSIQLIGDYYSKRLSSPGNSQSRGMFNMNVASSQGYIDPFWGFDMAIKKNFTKSKIAALKPFSITLNFSDIAGTRYFRTFSNITGGITQNSWRRMNPFYVSLNISFRFGKLDANTQKKKNTKESDSDDTGMGM